MFIAMKQKQANQDPPPSDSDDSSAISWSYRNMNVFAWSYEAAEMKHSGLKITEQWQINTSLISALKLSEFIKKKHLKTSHLTHQYHFQILITEISQNPLHNEQWWLSTLSPLSRSLSTSTLSVAHHLILTSETTLTWDLSSSTKLRLRETVSMIQMTWIVITL